MVYITLEELKDTLPAIMNDWIDVGDESWEWIFNAIEQNCHVGKKKKDKKKQKTNIESMVDTHSVVLSAHRNDIDELNKKVDELSNKINSLSDRHSVMSVRINRMDKDITAAKSMAETAKQRTDVSYDQISKSKNDADVIQDVYNRMAGRGATREELDGFRDVIHKYNALEKKEIPITREHSEGNKCASCKHKLTEPFDQPCIGCCYNGINISGLDKWEAKDE